jgi:hypothetical protein
MDLLAHADQDLLDALVRPEQFHGLKLGLDHLRVESRGGLLISAQN